MASESEQFRIKILHLKNSLGPDRLDYASIIKVVKHPDGHVTYHLGSLSRILPDDLGREKAKEILVKGGGIELVESG